MPIASTLRGFTKSTLPLAGVTAAVLIPRTGMGSIDIQAFRAQLEFLLDRGIRGIAVNGATGEYTLTTAVELRCMLKMTREVLGADCRLVAGVGGANVLQTRQWCEIAVDEGAEGVLLPMPYFFPYGQDDLVTYVEAVTEGLVIPAYLYNLPSFTTPLEPATSVDLIGRLANVAGIKDSSGSLETVTQLRRDVPDAACILGNDAALHAALAAGVCDGVVSGVSCVLPELMLRLYAESAANTMGEEALRLKAALDEFIVWLNLFPVPWGLKMIAEARGLGAAEFPMPLSAEKQARRLEFVAWFEAHRESLFATEQA